MDIRRKNKMPNTHFSKYVSPNIVIVPTMSFSGPPLRQKPNAACQSATQAIPVVSVANNSGPCAKMFPIENFTEVECQPKTQTFPMTPTENNNSLYASVFPMENCTDAIKFPTENNTNSVPIQKHTLIPSYAEDASRNYLEDSELRVKKTLSWASNYLQSIGQSQPKVIKQTNSAHQKLIPKVEDGQIRSEMQSAEQNANENLFKPTFRYLDVAKSHPSSLQQSLYTKSTKNMATMQSSSENSNSYDTKHPIKINLLYNKVYTDTYNSDCNLNSIDNPNTPIFIKPNTEIRKDFISTHSYSKLHNKNNIDNEKCVKDSKTQHFEKNITEKKTNCISKPLHAKSSEMKNIEKEKHDKDIKHTNSMSTPNSNISIKRYAGINKDKIKKSKESELLVNTKNLDKCLSKSRYKSKDELKKISKKPLHFHAKEDARPSNRIKTISEKPAHSHSNKSTSKIRSESKNDKMKSKSRESTVKNKGKDDQKIQSKSSTKRKDKDHKNISKSSMKSNEYAKNKTSEKQHSTSIKSVVQVKKNNDLDSPFKTVPENGHNVEDLRTKLKRKYQNTQTTKRDNLIITVHNDNNDKEDIDKQPVVEKKSKSEKKKKYKKIKLVINVVCEKCSDSSESDSDIKNNEENPLTNVDLSFLDDFNIDDIVQSLNDPEDKVNVNICPSNTTDSKNTTENLVGEDIVKNDKNKEKECFDLQKRFNTESLHHKIDLKQKINALDIKENKNDKSYRTSEIIGNAIQTSNNILDPVQNQIEKTELEEPSNTISVTDTSNKLIISPIKMETNQNNNKHDLDDIGFSNMYKELKKVFQGQDNNTDKELIDSKLHIESNVGITNMRSETETQAETKGGIIIDLTHKDAGLPHDTKKASSNNDVVNTRLLKQEAAKQRKTREMSEMNAIIDLTVSTETTSEIKKGVMTSDIQASAQQELKIKETFTEYNTETQSIVKTSKNKHNTNEDKLIIEVPLRPQHNEIKVTMTENNIIDLTIPTEFTSGVKNKAIKTADIIIQPLITQQSAPQENLAKDNIHSQSIETASQIKNNKKVTSAKNEASKTLSNNAEIKQNTKKSGGNHDIANVQTTEKAAELWQHDINEMSLNNVKMENIANKDPVMNDIFKEQTAEIKPGQQQHKANERSLHNAEMKKHTNVSGLPQHKTNETSSNNAETENISKESSVHNNIVNVGIAQTSTGPNHHETNKMSSNSDMNNSSPLLTLSRYETEIASATPNNIIRMAYSQASRQARGNGKPTSKKEQARTGKETNLGDDCDDVLSITDSLDENLTSFNLVTTDSNKTPIYSPTSSIKTLVLFDTKEATTETIKSIPESKDTETNNEGKSRIESNKEKSDSSVNVKSNCKQDEQLIALEDRMLGYLGTKYSIESLISHGKFSKIYLCKDDNGRNYALKVLNKGNRIAGCRIEDMLKDLQKDIPRQNYHCVFLVNGFAMLDQWCLLMDYYPKNMQEVLYENGKSFHIDVVQMLARQLISAVLILRNNNIMHLDIKPSHILMNTSNDRLKLAGFDESQYLEGLSVLPCVGTVNYRPPEVILGFPYFGKIDVWSTALVIYEMCTARQLFPGHYNNDILYKQMCTLGNIPYEMVIQSVFTNKHYRGACFARRYGPAWHQCVLIDKFNKSMRLATSLFEAYHRDWATFRTRRQKTDDSTKLRILRDLLQEMLVLDPNCRTPIEFVYVNPFIYETFNTCM